MSQQPASVTGDQTAKAPALVCCPVHNAPDPSASSCRWWAHRTTSPCLPFGLGPAGPHGRRPGHQALSHGPQPQAWLQGGAPVTLRAGYTVSFSYQTSGSSEPFFVWPLA